MIQHIVLVQFRGDITDVHKQTIWDDLSALKHIINGLESTVFGTNVSPEGLEQGYNDGFVMTFTDANARDAYLEHPEHKAAGARLVAALEGGLDGLLVVDL